MAGDCGDAGVNPEQRVCLIRTRGVSLFLHGVVSLVTSIVASDFCGT